MITRSPQGERPQDIQACDSPNPKVKRGQELPRVERVRSGWLQRPTRGLRLTSPNSKPARSTGQVRFGSNPYLKSPNQRARASAATCFLASSRRAASAASRSLAIIPQLPSQNRRNVFFPQNRELNGTLGKCLAIFQRSGLRRRVRGGGQNLRVNLEPAGCGSVQPVTPGWPAGPTRG